MDDLVKRPADRSKARTADDFIRLLRGEECNDCVNNFCTCDVIERAADCIEAQAKRIEQLEEALKQAGLYAWQGDTFKIMDIARAALGKKAP